MTVKDGGVLVYSTCTATRRENQGVVERFLAARPDYSVEPVGAYVNPSLATPEGYLCTFTQAQETQGQSLDAFFAARLVRRIK